MIKFTTYTVPVPFSCSIENFVYTMAKFDVSSCTVMVCVSDPLCMKLCAESSFPCYDYQHSDYHPVRMLFLQSTIVSCLVDFANLFFLLDLFTRSGNANKMHCVVITHCAAHFFVMPTERTVALRVGTDRRTEAAASAQSTRKGGKC